MSQSQKVAYLGPEGTYCEQALEEFAPGATPVSCSSIAGVFDAVLQGKADCGFVPIENVLEGPVTATLDLLLENKGRVFVGESHLLPIRHALGVIEGGSLETTQSVYSHPQALRQCTRFLHEQMPEAVLRETESTSQAAAVVRKIGDASVGAIASEHTLLNNQLKVLESNIADTPGNKTRFVLIRPGDIKTQDLIRPEYSAKDNEELVTSVCLHPGKDRQGILFEIIEILSVQHRVNLLSIHSRPDAKGGFVFNMDLEGHISDETIQQSLASLKSYCSEKTAATAEVAVLGSYKRVSFNPKPFHTLGIVGGKGVMGKWFERFFGSIGMEVLIHDRDSSISLGELVKRADVLLLSLPMGEVEEFVAQATVHLREGQLIVENCSIKNSALPHLEQLAHKAVEVLGIHTLFGPSVESLRDEAVVITKTDLSGPKAKAFEDLLYKHGARLIPATQSEHDSESAFHQSLVHLITITLAELLSENHESIDAVSQFSTPNSRALIDAMARVLTQSDELIQDFQTLNAEAPVVRRRFLEKFFGLVSALEYGEVEELMKSVEKGRCLLKE